MNARHICIGAMTCLLFLFVNCDTMDDVKKMESETNNLTLIAASGGGGGGGSVCYPGALILSPGGSKYMGSAGSGSMDHFCQAVVETRRYC